MADQTLLYTEPIISKPASGEWCLFFRFYNEAKGKMQVIKRTEELNRIRDVAVKEIKFAALLAARKQWLEQGWNPITDPQFKKRFEVKELTELDVLKAYTLSQAIDFAFQKKVPDWKKKTVKSFESVIKFIKIAADDLGLLETNVVTLKRAHYLDILERARKNNKLTGQGFNKYRSYLRILIDKIVVYDVLEYNPLDKLEKKKVVKKKAHRPPTKDEQLIIMNRVREVSRNYYRFLAVEYGCCIRPNEICHLKIKDLHRIEQVFRLVPDEKSENTKTSIERDAVIPDWLMELLMELNLHNYNPNDYIFSTHNKYGSFLPGPNKMHVNTSSGWWRKIVKAPISEGGLGLNISQYSLKKLAGDDLIRLKRMEGTHNLISIAQQQMGHANASTTRIYTEMDEEINREIIKHKMQPL